MIEFIILLVALVILWKLFTAETPPEDNGDARVVFVSAHYGGIAIEGDITKMILREGQRRKLTGQPTRKSGNPAAYEEGSARWELSDTDNFKMTVSPSNELEADVECLDGDGDPVAVVSCTVDGDPDADQERILVGTLTLVGTRGEATEFGLSASAAEDVPEEVVDEEEGNEGGGEPGGSEGGEGSGESSETETDTETGGGGDTGSETTEEQDPLG